MWYNNPYVQWVNEDRVYFTAEFKNEFWRLYREEGMSAYDILRGMGIDYYILRKGSNAASYEN